MRKVIRARQLIDGKGGDPIPSPVVIIEDGRILSVGRSDEYGKSALEGCQLLDRPDMTILPGLIHTHVHLVLDPTEPSAKGASGIPNDQLLLRAVRNAQLLLAAGITTARDVGAGTYSIMTLRDCIARNVIAGPRLLVCGYVITTTKGHAFDLGLFADNEHEVRKVARTLLGMGADFLKVIATGGHGEPYSNPVEPQYSVAEIRAAVEEAHRRKKRVACHAHGPEGIRAAVEAGVDTIEHCSFRGYKAIEYDPAVAEEIARRGIYVSLGITADYYLPDRENRPMTPVRRESFDMRHERDAAYRDMLSLGVKIIPSNDAGCIDTRFQDLYLSAKYMVDVLGVSPLQSIQAITQTAAEALGLEDEIGTVEPGKCADLILVPGDPSRDLLALRNVDTVIKCGEIVAERGKIRVSPLH